MPIFATALFLHDAVLAVHRFDARSPDHVAAATDDVASKPLMANQISAVMHHFYQMTFFWRRWRGPTRPSRWPHGHSGCKD
jgi:hypothetical protein